MIILCVYILSLYIVVVVYIDVGIDIILLIYSLILYSIISIVVLVVHY